MQERRYDIDWLRVLTIMLVFFFHCARFFGGGPWHLKNPEESFVAHIFIMFLDLWIMPLFFLLSGAGSWYALRTRNGGQYLLDRIKRIIVPLYGIGVFVIALPQVYFEAITNRGYTDSFFELMPQYFAAVFTTPPDFSDPIFFNIFMGHLWFLHHLFLISLLVLPVLLYLKSESGTRLTKNLAHRCEGWGGIFIFLIPLVVVRIAFTHLFEGHHSWAHLFLYAVFFVIGYLIPSDDRFTIGIKKVGWLCLALGIIGLIVEFAIIFGFSYNYLNIHHKGGEPLSLMYLFFSVLICTASWSWVVFMLSLAAKYLNRQGQLLIYSNEAVLPFFLLHQTVILCIGWYVIQWNIGMALKYLIIAAASFVLIMTIYELLIRRFNVMRFLFGMRPKRAIIDKHEKSYL